ncbi:MAG: sigma-70 family RNA polymerase sigma factor [Gudongella sp.]|nr:sigma-70 family RNA polymerase sigma factor [Gudongella sp.]
MDIQKLYKESYLGDKESEVLILEKLKPLIISSIRKYNNNWSEFDDLIQEGREMILICIKDYNPNINVPFLGYVKSRLMYLYLNKLKTQKNLSLNEVFGQDGEEYLELLESKENILESVLKRDLYTKLNECIDTLPRREKEVLRDFFFHDLTITQISKKYNVTYRTVLNQKTNALKKLRERMKDNV